VGSGVGDVGSGGDDGCGSGGDVVLTWW
jgi:hypothetical protein